MSVAVRQGIYSKLTGTKAITDLVGSRIYHAQAPPASAFPCVIFNKQGGRKTRTMQTPEAVRWDTWLVKAVDRSTSSNLADEVASAIDATLDGGSLSVSGKLVADLHHVGDVEYLEDSGDQQYRHSGANYQVVLIAP